MVERLIDGMTDTERKMLKWALISLYSIITGAVLWLCVDRVNMPHEYVRLERYQADQCRLEKQNERILTQVDKILEELRKK
jgi:hypothetical protein